MKNRGIIKRLIMGKPREKDFTEDDLPATRRKQFGFLMRTRFGVMFRFNLLSALFFVPLAVWELLVSGYVSNYLADMTVAEQLSKALYLSLLRYGTEIPLFMLGFVGLTGAFYIARRISWGQSVKLLKDFGTGIKQSYKQFLLIGLVTGIVNLIANYIIDYSVLSLTVGNSLLWTFVLVLAALFMLIFAVAVMFALCCSSLYNITFGRLFLGAFTMTFKTLFSSVGVCLLSLLPLLVFMFMPWAFVRIIGYCVAAVFSIGFAVTMQTVYSFGVFDRFINEKQYPDFVRMGLRGSGSDETDEDAEADGDEIGDESFENSADATENGDMQSAPTEGGEQ